MYAVGPLEVQSLDLTKLGDHHSVQHIPPKEVTVSVSVKDDKAGTSLPTGECKSRHRKVIAKIFVRDPFNPICFSEDAEK